MNVHVYPINDLKEHNTEDFLNCNCNPRVETINGNFMIIHNSYDGREIIENTEFNMN